LIVGTRSTTLWSSRSERWARLSLREAFPSLFNDRWQEAQKLYLDTFTATHLERIAPVAGAEALLEALAERHYYLAVVSNKTGRVLRLEANHLAWARYFTKLVGAGDAGADKPDAAPVRLALEGSEIGPKECWYVGDTALDMECAANAGCRGVLVGHADPADSGFAQHPPTMIFPDLPALARHIRGL